MKLTKIIVAVTLLITSVDFAEAAPLTLEAASTATTLQLPPPPPPPGLPRFGRRRRYVRHRYVRHGRGIHFRLPPPPPRPPLPRL